MTYIIQVGSDITLYHLIPQTGQDGFNAHQGGLLLESLFLYPDLNLIIFTSYVSDSHLERERRMLKERKSVA